MTRLIHVHDIVEPRCKVGDESSFPGLVGPVKTVGEGTTYRLKGAAVVSVGEPVAGEATYWSEAVIDVSDAGRETSPVGSAVLLVLNLEPHSRYLKEDGPDAEIQDVMSGSLLAQQYNRQSRIAMLKVAAYLAQTAVNSAADSTEVFELFPPDRPLPRVAYLFQVVPWVYGDFFTKYLPTLLHPNEVMDGGLVCQRKREASSRECTYFYQNHSVIDSLYERHGKEIDFVGVVLYPMMPFDMDAKERVAEQACKLMRMLKVEAVCASSLAGGNPWIEFMLFCQKCERTGIKTVLVLPEPVGAPEDPGFVHYVPEAVAIVSSGRTTQSVSLPAVQRVIGGKRFFDMEDDPAGALDLPLRYLVGSTTNLGYGPLGGKDY